MWTQYLIFISSCAWLTSFSVFAEQEIRIAIGKPYSQLAIQGSSLVVTMPDSASLPKQKTVQLQANSSGIKINGKQFGSEIIKINSLDNILIEGRQYRNSIEIKWQLEQNTPKLLLIHSLPIETYIVGIVSSEVPKHWPLEALKAQAIAARTFAIWQKFRRLDKSYHLESSVLDQVYGGAQKEHPLADLAVQQTKGQILTYDAKPIQAYFHATCGGHTESAADVWGSNLAYLPGNQCGYCKTSPQHNWTYRVSKKDLTRALKPIFSSNVSDLKIVQKTKSGRIKLIELSNRSHKKQISGAQFRELLGYNNIRSTLIDKISFGWHEITFSGRGHGHGVGLCQWGAMGMAKSGFSAEKILAKYYPNTEIRQLY